MPSSAHDESKTAPAAPPAAPARHAPTTEGGSLATQAVQRPILLREKGDLSRMVAEAGGPRRHPMRGFDPDYVDIVDYIVRITHRIWEEKAVGLIYDTYGHNIAFWTTDGLMMGREAVVASTLQSLAAYPHVRIYVDDVVWSGNEDDGFHTSMRATSVRYNTGYSQYGPPTGRRIQRQAIANCFVKENRIIEEWTVHDEMTVVRQLGFDPFEVAARAARVNAARGVLPRNGENERLIGQLAPAPYPPKQSGGGFDVDDFLRRMTHEVWNRRLLNEIDTYYHPGFIGHASPGKEFYSRGDLKVHVLGLLGAFPDAEVRVEHLYWNEDRERGEYRTALRWSLTGTHDGPGPYGPPSGKQAYLMGITQHRIRDGAIVEEWSVFDELALLKQLAIV